MFFIALALQSYIFTDYAIQCTRNEIPWYMYYVKGYVIKETELCCKGHYYPITSPSDACCGFKPYNTDSQVTFYIFFIYTTLK